ncbi:MAG: hypothetical protein K2Y39_25360 [Candidatus Obscuribacterales bacterium]|nr:hypothetical protein [Candidatus Obscuribacterales bacterium]
MLFITQRTQPASTAVAFMRGVIEHRRFLRTRLTEEVLIYVSGEKEDRLIVELNFLTVVGFSGG